MTHLVDALRRRGRRPGERVGRYSGPTAGGGGQRFVFHELAWAEPAGTQLSDRNG